jgi:hypothetical protein
VLSIALAFQVLIRVERSFGFHKREETTLTPQNCLEALHPSLWHSSDL